MMLALPMPSIEPVPEASVSTLAERTLEDRERWWKKGLKAISEGKLAVLLLSGGQVCISFIRFQCIIFVIQLQSKAENFYWIEQS